MDEQASIVRILPTQRGSLDPREPASYESFVSELIFDPLFVVDRALEIIPNPNVVAQVNSDDDGLTWTVRLRPGLSWHDGMPFTSEDVSFSWEGLQADQTLLAGIQAVDAQTLVFHLRERSAAPLRELTFPILPRHRAAGVAPEDFEAELRRRPIGNGPYRIEEVDAQRVVLARWEAYSGRKPYIARVEFRYVPDAAARIEALLAPGGADEMELSANQFRWDVNGPAFSHLRKIAAPRAQFDYIAWNLRFEPLSEVRVRQALALAVDLETLRKQRFGELFPPFKGTSGGAPWASAVEDANPPPAFDAARANALLDEAGWRSSQRGAIRERDGRQLRLRLAIPREARSFLPVALALQESWARVGVGSEIELLGFRELQARLAAGEFEAAARSLVVAPTPAEHWAHWGTDAARNFGGYSNARLDGLFDTLQRSEKTPQRAAALREIESLLQQDQPCLFLWSKPALWVFSRRVRGMEFGPRGPVGYFPGAREWWVSR